MEINWIIIGVVGIGVIVLLIYLIRQNNKDEKELESFLNKSERRIREEDEFNDN